MTDYVDGILLSLQPGRQEVPIPHILTVVHTVRSGVKEREDTLQELSETFPPVPGTPTSFNPSPLRGPVASVFVEQRITCYLFFGGGGHAYSMQKFPDQGSNLSHSSDNAGSLTARS